MATSQIGSMEPVVELSDGFKDYMRGWVVGGTRWCKIGGVPEIQAIESQVWSKEKERKRSRRILLDSDSMISCVILAGSGGQVTMGQLAIMVADDSTPKARERARRRVSRMVKILEAYELLEVRRIPGRKTPKYEISASKSLVAILIRMYEGERKYGQQ